MIFRRRKTSRKKKWSTKIFDKCLRSNWCVDRENTDLEVFCF